MTASPFAVRDLGVTPYRDAWDLQKTLHAQVAAAHVCSERVRAFLRAEPDAEIIGECGNGPDAIAAIETRDIRALRTAQIAQLKGDE